MFPRDDFRFHKRVFSRKMLIFLRHRSMASGSSLIKKKREYDWNSLNNIFIFYHGCVLKAFEERNVRIDKIFVEFGGLMCQQTFGIQIGLIVQLF